jgi:cation diffusion facilitator CzcD-associated flavoprotein CzcO
MNDTNQTSTVVIGAGPYGLSIAAHLRAQGTDLRIFGLPMHRWLNQMPRGMFLKSEGFASSLSEPTGRFTLGRYCAERGVPYDHRAIPVAIETFTEYALAFQREFVPVVEEVHVSQVKQTTDGFDLQLENGERFRAKKVVVATGLEHTVFVPPALAQLPPALGSHSSEHRDLTGFQGKTVAVIGAGQSSLETAALLTEAGATVRVIVRKPALQWNVPPRLGTLNSFRRLRYPVSGLGEGVKVWAFSAVPQHFRVLPRQVRIQQVMTVLDAAGAWWLRSRVEGKVNIMVGSEVQRASAQNGRVSLEIRALDGKVTELTVDHVISATGYHYDVCRLPFLSDDVKQRLRTEDHRPVVSRHLESTVPGLYFAGMATAYCFGPLMRFVAGVGHASEILSSHIAEQQSRYSRSELPQIAEVSN